LWFISQYLKLLIKNKTKKLSKLNQMSKVQDNVAAAIAADPPKNKQEEAAEDDPNTVSYGALHFRRRLLRTKHVRYQKTAKDLVAKLSEPGADDTPKDAVKFSYSLLRVFSLTYNFINLEKDDDKAVIPTDFSDELKQVLTEANFEKFSAAFKGPKEEYDKCLPETIEKSVSDLLIKFVQAKESDHINARYEKELTELTTQIDSRKSEPRPKQVRKRKDSTASADKEKKSPASRSKKSSPKSDDESLEDQMTSLLKKINDKSRFIKL